MARRPRLWVIDPSLHHAEHQGVAEVLHGWSGESRIFRPALEPSTGPDSRTGYDTDAVVLLGSAASVYDTHTWLTNLGAWMRPLLHGEPRLPLLGICFGHQMIAHLARAPIGYLDAAHAKRVGVEPTRLAGGRLLLGEPTLRVVVSHREEVQQVPDGFRVTARRPGAPIDGLEHEELPLFSFQFHPEAREEFARRAGLCEQLIDPALREDGRRVLSGFLDQVRPVADAG